jgi:serine/threonine protein kinase
MREKLRTLLIQRQIPFLSSTDNMEVLKLLGSGTFGIVEVVRYQKKLYAHKRPLYETPEKCNSILEEAIKLTDITEYHPNIQRLYYINLKSYGFLMDYCHCGSLDKVIVDNNSKYTLVDVINWAYQLADALSFLHSKGISKLIISMNFNIHLILSFFLIVHRDVKAENILLKDNCQTLVLTDYGTATQLGRSLLTNEVGTPSM